MTLEDLLDTLPLTEDLSGKSTDSDALFQQVSDTLFQQAPDDLCQQAPVDHLQQVSDDLFQQAPSAFFQQAPDAFFQQAPDAFFQPAPNAFVQQASDAFVQQSPDTLSKLDSDTEFESWLESMSTYDFSELAKLFETVTQVTSCPRDDSSFNKPLFFQCQQCPRRFRTEDARDRHEDRHRKFRLRCSRCRFWARCADSLDRHNHYFHFFVRQRHSFPSF